jgi:hypothetical protein
MSGATMAGGNGSIIFSGGTAFTKPNSEPLPKPIAPFAQFPRRCIEMLLKSLAECGL